MHGLKQIILPLGVLNHWTKKLNPTTDKVTIGWRKLHEDRNNLYTPESQGL
jgi:hypothetical protein